MIYRAITPAVATEKHSLDNTFVGLFDRRSRTLWMSTDPLGEQGMTGRAILDNVPEADRAFVREQVSRCVVDGETVSYMVWGPAPSKNLPEHKSQFRVTLIPANVGEAAFCAICTVLPARFDEITERDRKILRLLADGADLGAIATEVHLSASAVDNAIRRLKGLVGRDTLAGLVAVAIRQAII